MASYELPPQCVVIRYLREDDLPHLEWHGGPDLRGFYRQGASAHRAGEVVYLIAELNGFPVGQVIVHWSGKTSQPGMPDLQSLRVHPVMRGQGVGSLLLETAEACVLNAGHRRVTLSVGVENPKARKLYERCGYRAIGDIYTDEWESRGGQGQLLRFSELVVDMVKELGSASPEEFQAGS